MAELLVIRKATGDDLRAMMELLRDCARDMVAAGIDQWDETFPPEDFVKKDIAAGTAHLCLVDGHIAGMFTMDENQSAEYRDVDWKLKTGRIAVIHRLAVSPKCHRRGIASHLMDFAENRAAADGYEVIRLDTYSRNYRAVAMYLARGYYMSGKVFFRGKPIHFDCFEKQVS